jgi:hypothetical protein
LPATNRAFPSLSILRQSSGAGFLAELFSTNKWALSATGHKRSALSISNAVSFFSSSNGGDESPATLSLSHGQGKEESGSFPGSESPKFGHRALQRSFAPQFVHCVQIFGEANGAFSP